MQLVRSTLTTALEMVIELGAKSVASPTLATGYGPLSIGDFGKAIDPLVEDVRFGQLTVTLVVRRQEDADVLRECIANSPSHP